MAADMLYAEMTHDIIIEVQPTFLPEQSDPEAGRYVWAYAISIDNRGIYEVQLKRRYWRITDAYGNIEEVRGDGVVGEQPVIAPGESYEYRSGAPLKTPSGFMAGHYEMEREDGVTLIIRIPAFSLDSPYDQTAVH